MNVDKLVSDIEEKVIGYRRELHENPCLSEHEEDTCKRISSWLFDMNIEHEVVLDNKGIIAIIRGAKDGKTVALRADIDALPVTEMTTLSYKSKTNGVMHACGHDAHTAIALGAACILKKLENKLEGNVKIFFQPAEETIGGAERLISVGCLENPYVDNVIGLHLSPEYPANTVAFKYGKMYAGSDMFDIILTGKGCHGAHPENGCDTIAMSAQVISTLQTVVSRNVSPTNSAVVTIGKIHGGTGGNIICDKVVMTGIIRTLDQETRLFLRERVQSVVEDVASAFGGKGEFVLRPSYAPLVNDNVVVEQTKDVAVKVLGKDNVIIKENPSLGCEDFAFFAQERPSCFYDLGSGYIDREENYPLHNPMFEPNECCLKTGVLLQVSATLALLKK
ncbi:MAG: M20 family metallopeptidase [Synergistaceae bacterium]